MIESRQIACVMDVLVNFYVVSIYNEIEAYGRLRGNTIGVDRKGCQR